LLRIVSRYFKGLQLSKSHFLIFATEPEPEEVPARGAPQQKAHSDQQSRDKHGSKVSCIRILR
jgi:hypothetical protein